MKKILIYLFGSLDNDTSKVSASARKLSGFAAVITSIFITIKHSNENNSNTLVITWLTFAAVCFGILTIAELIKLKNNTVNVNSSSNNTTITDTAVTNTKVN